MRRFFHFTVRDLLWFTLVVAVGLAWFVRERAWIAHEQQLQAEAYDAREDAGMWRNYCDHYRAALARLTRGHLR